MHEALLMIVCFGGVVLAVVDAHDDRDVLVARRRRDDDLLRAGVDVLARVGGLGEEAGRLDHDVDAEIAPRQVRRVALGEDLDVLAGDADAVVGRAHLAGEPAQDAVVLQQVRHGLLVTEVVRGDEFDVGTRCGEGAEEVAADPAEAVDAHAYGHCVAPRNRLTLPGPTLSNPPDRSDQPQLPAGSAQECIPTNQASATLRVRSVAWPSAGAVRAVQTGWERSMPQFLALNGAQIAWPCAQ